MVSLDLRPVIAMSRAVSTTAPLPEILATIAGAAAELLHADAAVILIASPSGLLRFAAEHGLTHEQRQAFLDGTPDGSLEAVFTSQLPQAVAGFDDHTFTSSESSLAKDYRAMLALPLCAEARCLGTLSVYRRRRSPWRAEARGLMELIGANAASAVRAAQLIDEQNNRISVHARLVQGLRAQSHAHMEKLTELRDHLDGGSLRDVVQAVDDLEHDLSEHYQKVNERIDSRIVAALLLGEANIARNRGVRFVLDARSTLTGLPQSLTEFDLVTIVSNLLENAFDAVADVPKGRSRTSLLVHQSHAELRVRVRDWGVGLPAEDGSRLTSHGFTTKPGHTGIGLALISELVESRGGELRLSRCDEGTVVEVVVPYEC